MALPVVLTVAVMPLTYSIANGIGVGFIAWVVLRSAAGKAREISPLLWIVAARIPGVLRARVDRHPGGRLSISAESVGVTREAVI